MPTLKEKLQFISEGGSVERYHTRSGIKPDTDAHHSHGVAMLCALLSGAPSANLLMAALTHDLAEQGSSDVSAGSKEALGIRDVVNSWEQTKLQEYGLYYQDLLTLTETTILRLADQFDCLMYCCREFALGNRNALLIWRRTCERLENLHGSDVPLEVSLRASNVYEAIKEIYHETGAPGGPDFDIFKIAEEANDA